MDEQYAIDGLAALLQTTRLKAFRLLVSHEPGGVAAGEIARAMDVPQNTMWARHLDALRTGSERAAIASIICRSNLERFRALIAFLLQDCCGGRSDVFKPILAEIKPCCPPARKRKDKSRA